MTTITINDKSKSYSSRRGYHNDDEPEVLHSSTKICWISQSGNGYMPVWDTWQHASIEERQMPTYAENIMHTCNDRCNP